MVKSLQTKKKLLKRLGFYDIGDNAFDNLCFGAFSKGINGSTPPESLHQWHLGIVTFVLDYFLERLTSKAKTGLDEMIKICTTNFGRQSDSACSQNCTCSVLPQNCVVAQITYNTGE